jgi:hypothetical protein
MSASLSIPIFVQRLTGVSESGALATSSYLWREATKQLGASVGDNVSETAALSGECVRDATYILGYLAKEVFSFSDTGRSRFLYIRSVRGSFNCSKTTEFYDGSHT